MPTIARSVCRRCALQAVLAWASATVTASVWAAPMTLKFATWNLEWFLTPATFNTLKAGCTRGDQSHRRVPRSIPCDVAANQERSATDIAGLARYARTLDADVVALQEVDGPSAARQVFPRHEFCFTGGRAVQNTGFAIRRGLPFRCGADLTAMSLGDTVRRGATMQLFPGTSRELYMLAVHLKSGCSRQALNSSAAACERLARQAPALHDWVQAQRAARHRFVVLGDFNRDLLAESWRMSGIPGGEERGAASDGNGLWAQLSRDAVSAALINTASGEAFHNCYRGQTHTGYIDYILLGDSLASKMVHGSFQRLSYSATDAWRLKLSDHCPVAIRLRLD